MTVANFPMAHGWLPGNPVGRLAPAQAASIQAFLDKVKALPASGKILVVDSLGAPSRQPTNRYEREDVI